MYLLDERKRIVESDAEQNSDIVEAKMTDNRSIQAKAGFICLIVGLMIAASDVSASPPHENPKIVNFWGICANDQLNKAQDPDYTQWGRYDLLVVADVNLESLKKLRHGTRAVNPRGLIVRTESLTNAYEKPPGADANWCLYRPDGSVLKYWNDQIRINNILDERTQNCMLGMIGRIATPAIEQGIIDGVFFDSVAEEISWFGEIDIDRDGRAEEPNSLNARWVAGQQQFFQKLLNMKPSPMILINDGTTRHCKLVNGRVFEGQVDLDNVAEGSLSAIEAVEGLASWIQSSRQPPLTFALMCHPAGNQEWRRGKGRDSLTPGLIDMVERDFRRMRLGLGISLMAGCYYSYDFGTSFYGLPLWYPEYDVPLGKARGPYQKVALDRQRDRVLLDWKPAQPLPGRQHPGTDTRNGLRWSVQEANAPASTSLMSIPVSTLGLKPGDSFCVDAEFVIDTNRAPSLQWMCRSDKGLSRYSQCGTINIWQKNLWINRDQSANSFKVTAHGTLEQFDDYRFLLNISGKGLVEMKRLVIRKVAPEYMIRRFEGGVVVVNPLPIPITVQLPGEYMALRSNAPAVQMILDEDQATCSGKWNNGKEEGQYYASGYRLSNDPNARATWQFTIPETGCYRLSAAIMGGEKLCPDAKYRVGQQQITLDQRKGDGGWKLLTEIQAHNGEVLRLTLSTGSEGMTVADAVVLENVRPLQSGQKLRTVTIGALDSRILLAAD